MLFFARFVKEIPEYKFDYGNNKSKNERRDEMLADTPSKWATADSRKDEVHERPNYNTRYRNKHEF